MNTKIGISLLLLVALPAAAEAPHWRYAKTIQNPAVNQEALVAATLDSEVFEAAGEAYANLRILDGTGEETPYLLEKSVETREEILHVPHAGEVVDMKPNSVGIEILLRVGKNSPPTDGFTVHTPLRDYEYRVRVQGTQDGERWTPLVEDAHIYDYSRYMDVVNRNIALPTNTFPRYKLIVEAATQLHQTQDLNLIRKLRAGQEQERSESVQIRSVPLRIDRIEFWHNVKQTRTEASRNFSYPTGPFTLQQDEEKRSTVITLTSRKEPLTRLILRSSNRNFSRKASLQVPQRQGVRTQWREVAQASLQSLSFQNVQREQTAIDFPEQRQAEYRIILYDQDAPPLPIDAIETQGNRYQLLFLAQPGKIYRLHYGADNAQAAHYDTTSLAELRRSYAPQEAALGPQQDLSPSSGFSLGKLLDSTAFFIVAILLMLALLVWSVVGIGRRINGLEG